MCCMVASANKAPSILFHKTCGLKPDEVTEFRLILLMVNFSGFNHAGILSSGRSILQLYTITALFSSSIEYLTGIDTCSFNELNSNSILMNLSISIKVNCKIFER